MVSKTLESISKKVTKAPRKRLARGNAFYINNAELLEEVRKSREAGRMTEEFGRMILLLCKRYATIPRFVRYSYNEDMQAFAAMTVCHRWRGFNPEKGVNPFAYYTRCIHNAFFQFNNVERNERDIRDELRVQNGLNASYGYTERMSESHNEQDAYGDTDYQVQYDKEDPYADEVKVEEYGIHDPTAPGEVFVFSDEEIKILQMGHM